MIKSFLTSRYAIVILVELLVAYAFWSILDPESETSYWYWLLALLAVSVFVHIKDSIALFVNFFRHRNERVHDVVRQLMDLDLEPPSPLDFNGEDYLRRLYDGVHISKPLTQDQLKFISINLAAIDLFRFSGMYGQLFVTSWTVDRAFKQFKSARRVQEGYK
jgi:hypothetical protein